LKYCPLCAAEYRQQVENCSSCGAALVASLQAEEVRANPPRLLWIGGDTVEFDLVAGALRDAGIPELVEESPTRIFQKLLNSESQICVLQNDFDRAVQIASQSIAARPDLRGAVQKCHHCGTDCSASLASCPNCCATLIIERKAEKKNFSPEGTAIKHESKYCPLCNAEYPASFESCTVCGVELVPEGMRGIPLTEQSKKDRLVIVWRGGDPVAVSMAVSLLREAGIRHHVESTHDYFVFELAMPRPRYTVRVLQADSQQAGEVLAGVTDSPFFGVGISPDFPVEESVPVPTVSSNWNLAAATVEVWAGEDAALARVLEDCLQENRVGFRREDGEGRRIQLCVMPADESAAREIIREILEATPPA
jgi:hypothetical protein